MAFIFSLIPSLCNAGNDKQYIDNGKVVFEGNFPIDQNKNDNERKDSVIAKILINEAVIGIIETRDNNLELAYCAQGKNSKTIWQYTDYFSVNKITFDTNKNIIRIYYNGTILGVREKWYVNEFSVDTYELRRKLLRNGKWRL